MRALVALVIVSSSAAAGAEPARPVRVSAGAGGALLATGLHDGPRTRIDAHVAVMPGGRFGRFGVVGALRHVTRDPFAGDGLATLGVAYEAAAARPRLALALHGDVGVAIGDPAPAIGGGLETHLWIWPRRLGPLCLVFDLTAHLVIDGVEDTRLVIASATRVGVAW
jgi:hypothetical protein